VLGNKAKAVVRSTLGSHLDKSVDWLRNPGFPPLLPQSIRAILKHEEAKIMGAIDVVHAGGAVPLFGFTAEEQGIAMYVSVLPGESWEDARRFYAGLPSHDGKPYLSWVTRQLEVAHQAVGSNWLGHWVILVRPLSLRPDSFWFNVAFSLAGRSEKRFPKTQLYVHCSDLLNPEELETLAELMRKNHNRGSKTESRSWIKRLLGKCLGHEART